LVNVSSKESGKGLFSQNADPSCHLFSNDFPEVVLKANNLIDDATSHTQGIVPKNKKPVSNFTTGAKSFCFGNPAIQGGPVAFRPTITRGLALSIIQLLIF
jgi:hypothetical protein